MSDNDLITFGKFKGTAMANIPAWWLVWFWDENAYKSLNTMTKEGIEVLSYIKKTGIEYLRKEKESG